MILGVNIVGIDRTGSRQVRWHVLGWGGQEGNPGETFHRPDLYARRKPGHLQTYLRLVGVGRGCAPEGVKTPRAQAGLLARRAQCAVLRFLWLARGAVYDNVFPEVHGHVIPKSSKAPGMHPTTNAVLAALQAFPMLNQFCDTRLSRKWFCY